MFITLFFIGTCDGNLVSLNDQLQNIGDREQAALATNGYASLEARVEFNFLFNDIENIAMIEFNIINVKQVTVMVYVSSAGARPFMVSVGHCYCPR